MAEDVDDRAGSGEKLLKEGAICSKLLALLRTFAEKGFPEGALARAIDRHWVKILEECEDEPAEALQNYLLPELLFADHMDAQRGGSETSGAAQGLRQRVTALNTEPLLNELRLKDDSFWGQLLEKWVVGAPVAEIVMKPSKALVKKRAEAEKAGVEKRREALGTDGLNSCKLKLAAALESNAPKPLPQSAEGRMELAPVPPASSIPTLPLHVKQLKIPRSLAPRCSHAEMGGHGTRVQIVRTTTALHAVSVGFDTRRVAPNLRPWLVLLQVLARESALLLVRACACVTENAANALLKIF